MPNVITAIGKVAWESKLISALAHPMTGLQVQRRCVDAVDVLAVTKVLHCDAVIISDHTLRVDESFIADLVTQNIRVIALTADKSKFAKLTKIECVLIDESNPAAAVPTLSALIRVTKKVLPEPAITKGELIYVGGFGGGTGKSRLALELSAEISKSHKTLLVDADTYGPALNQLLGLLAENSGLLEVCRQVERQVDQTDLLTETVCKISEHFDFLPGLPKTSRWVDLRIAALNGFWERTIAEYEFVIVDAGPVFEPEPMIAIETGLPKRNLVTTSAFTKACKVVLTARNDSTSVTRIIRGIVEYQKTFSGKEVSVALIGPSVGKQSQEAVAAIQVHAGINNVVALNNDPDLIRETELGHGLIGIKATNSQLAKDYAQLTKSILEYAKTGKATSRLQKLMPKKKQAEVA